MKLFRTQSLSKQIRAPLNCPLHNNIRYGRSCSTPSRIRTEVEFLTFDDRVTSPKLGRDGNGENFGRDGQKLGRDLENDKCPVERKPTENVLPEKEVEFSAFRDEMGCKEENVKHEEDRLR